MSDRLPIRIASFTLATLVTWSLAAGIDTLAIEQHSRAVPMSYAPAASQVAAAKAAPRS